ncbi:MAG: sugar ABC transporter permease [Chloroflexi bacterium]|nr:MAG: sugar ABC transporter permease [Chloroflexota bacterium]
MSARTGVKSFWSARGAGSSTAYRLATLAPVLVLVAIFTLFPFVYSAVTSTHQVLLTLPDQTPFIGLQNYLDVLRDSSTQNAIKNTLVFTLLTVPCVTVLGLAVALLLNQQIRGFGILRALVLLPWAIPLVSAGIIWRLLLHGDFGALNGLLLQLGVVHDYMSWLSSPNLAMYAVALAHIWREFPLPAILFLAGLQLIPGDIVDASRVDGAGLWARFRNITLPYLRAPLLIVLVYETMISVSVFDLVYVLTGGGPGSSTTLFSWYAYATTFTFLNPGQGAALSFIMAAFLLALIIMFLRIVRVDEGEA